MNGIILAAIGGPFLVSLAATIGVRAWSRRVRFVDRPGGHKRHQEPVALGGGVAFLAAVCGPILVGTIGAWFVQRGNTQPEWLPGIVQIHLAGIASKLSTVLAIVGGASVLLVVGIIDDWRPLGPATKFVAQFAVAIFIAGPVGIRAVEALPAPLSIALTIVWIVVITNAFNFLDNMDGLSAGVAVIAAAIFAVTAARSGQVFVPVMAWVVVGSLLGFLVFNFPPATIFMGDAGSLPLGFLMSVLTILTTFYDSSKNLTPLGVIVPVVVLAVPLYDVFSVVIRRIRAGQSPLRGDWRHFSHRLVKRGMTPRGAVLTIYLSTAATGLPAIILPTVDWPIAVLLLLQCLAVVAMIAILEHTPHPNPERKRRAN